MNWLLFLDIQLFFLINRLPHNGLIDYFALFLSGIGVAGIVWFILGAILVLKEESKDHRLFIPLGLAGGMTWSLTELIIKPLVARLRPSSALDAAIVVGGFPLGYSFPSGHAASAFALATVLAYIEPKWKKGLYVLAILISLSRIYLGHHYPIDVIVGGLLGWVIGFIVVRWYKDISKTKRYNRKNEIKRKRTSHSTGRLRKSKSNQKKSHHYNS
ncbi:MAG: Undecaprenyl-diphosphatase [uncultured bacterium]|nr:MAG: Undecaprenyl-diphosphatase [uncultured bacterium]